MSRTEKFSPRHQQLLVLHAVRIKGMADADTVSRRFSLDRAIVDELLLDYEALGWIRWAGFAGVSGWSLTDAGRCENNRLLAAELEEAGTRNVLADSHAAFIQLNARFVETITNWQIRPTPCDPMAPNDHSDWRWDERVLGSLASLSRRLRPIGEHLAQGLTRFASYPQRFDAALDHARQGQKKWVDEPKIDSCHTVWAELHEDLLATLGLERGQEP